MKIFRTSNAFRAAAIYAIAAGFWILLSDRLIFVLVRNKQIASTIDTYNDWVFVLVTAYLFYWERKRADEDRGKEQPQLPAESGNYVQLILATLLPFFTLGLQWILWPYIAPFVWLLFIPTVFFSARLGGFKAGLFSTLLSAALAWYFFIPPQLSWELANSYNLFSVIVFVVVGYFFSDTQERLRAANRLANLALKESEARFSLILQTNPDGMLIVSKSGQIVQANEQAEKIFGFEMGALTGIIIEELLPQRSMKIHKMYRTKYIQQPHQRPLSLRQDIIGRRYDGSEFPAEVSLRLIDIKEEGYVVATVVDITERKQAENALRKSEEQYRLLFENAPIGILSIASDGVIVDVNPAALQILGSPSAEATKTINILNFPPLVNVGIAGDIQRSIETGQPVINESPYTTKWGKVTYLHYSITPVRRPDQPTDTLQILLEDITERKDMIESLRQAEEKYHSIFENSLEGVFQSLPEGRFITVNPAFARILGYESPAELIGTITDIASQVYVESPIRAEFTQAVIEQGAVTGFELQVKHKSGRLIWVSVSAHTVRDDAGRLIYFEGSFEDISERRQAQEAIFENERQMRALVTSLDDIVFEFDEQGTYLNVWTGNESLLVRPKTEMLGRRLVEVMGEENGRSFVGAIKRVLASDQSESIEYPLDVIGGQRWFLARISPIITQDNNSHKTASMLIRDITESKRAEEQIQLQLQRMRALNEIDRAINSGLDMRLSLNILINELLSQLGVDAAMVLLFNTYDQTLEYVAGQGFRTAAVRQIRMHLGEGLPGKAGLERKLLHIPDLSEAGSLFKRAELLKQEKFVEYFGIPLIAKGLLKGVLEIFHRSHLDTTPEWKNYLETLGGQAALAIDNAQLFENIQRSNLELATAYDATIEGWSHAMDLRDKETEGHSKRVTELTLKLAQRMGISQQEQAQIRHGALLHDIGKLGVPDQILLKPGKLTEEEWGIMRQHPTFAFDMLRPITYLQSALDIPYCHHEKWDGSGYPRGLKGEQIPLAARIFAIVDVWDALRSDRPYRAGWSIEKIREHIIEQSGKHFEPRVTEVFLDILNQSPDSR